MSCHVRSVQGQVRYVGVRIWQDKSGWDRLGQVMIMLGQVMQVQGQLRLGHVRVR